MLEMEVAELVAARGIVGDRFFDYKPDYKGQVTLFSMEIYDQLCAQFQVWDRPPSVFRRNLLVRGADLNQWIGKRFCLGEVQLEGVSECTPCYWMDEAFHPGTENGLKGNGGLRARILAGGTLRRGDSSARQPQVANS